jgi:CBS domain containing-hemolysin-like protein
LAILIFSEVIPKTAGVVYSRPLATLIAQPLQFLVWFFTPMIWLCQLATRFVSKESLEKTVSEEELVLMTRLGLQAGSIEPDEAEVIQNILSLESKKVRSIMTPRSVAFSLSIRLSVEEVRQSEGILNYSRIPVYDKDSEDVVGIIHRREVLSTQVEDPREVRLIKLLRPVHFVPDSLALDTLLRQFLESRQHMVMVIGEFGEWVGVVTLEDVLEEILGREIVDEFDQVVDLRELAHQRRERVLKEKER